MLRSLSISKAHCRINYSTTKQATSSEGIAYSYLSSKYSPNSSGSRRYLRSFHTHGWTRHSSGNDGTTNIHTAFRWPGCFNWRTLRSLWQWPTCIHPASRAACLKTVPQIARIMGPTWGPPGSCRPQIDPMMAPWSLLSGTLVENPLVRWILHSAIVGIVVKIILRFAGVADDILSIWFWKGGLWSNTFLIYPV